MYMSQCTSKCTFGYSNVLYVWDEQKLLKSINTKYQVLRKIGKNSELEKFSSL